MFYQTVITQVTGKAKDGRKELKKVKGGEMKSVKDDDDDFVFSTFMIR